MSLLPEREPEACGLCPGPAAAAAARYTCPRCNVRFCSVTCYRESRHRACAEGFYRDWVLGELRGPRGGAEERRGLRESLRRLRDGEAPAPAPGSGPRLWQALSEPQLREFERLVESGGAAAWIEEWRPWWERRPEAPVQELPARGVKEDRTSKRINADQSADDDGRPTIENEAGRDGLSGATERNSDGFWEQDDSIPSICGKIAPLLSLSSKPSPLIQYSVVNVLYSYAFSMKLINGDLSGEMRAEFIEAVMGISEALKGNRVFTSSAEALQTGLEAVRSSPYSSNPFEAVNTIKDTSVLLLGESRAPSGRYALAALSQLGRVLAKAKRFRPRDCKLDDRVLYMARKKCAFLLSWVSEHEDALILLSLEVQSEYKSSFETLLQMEETKSNLERAWGGKRPPGKKVLIEELTP
ncbi:zinc finger HIT domain-containing protein 2 [Heptranchias perlo]|uniref:zinc finger HIT domain-containing protein 2 n=1 Tax=Heptranchias perlo TaxID=212740 RepID=UPI00355966AE